MSTDVVVGEARANSYNWGEWESWCKETALRTASYLTDPVCKSRELWMRCQVVKDLHPDAYRVTNLFRQTVFLSGVAACGLAAVVCTLPAMALRYAVCRLQQQPYICRKGTAAEKEVQNATFSLLSWNICYTQAGFEITDGGVISSPERIQALSDKILEQDADVVCLYEVFDINTALYLYEQLKGRYAHFYFSMGPRVVGPPSGIFGATKFAVENPHFQAFPKEALDGRAKNCEKGIFSFDIKNCARVFATHLQHSEICAKPTPEEEKARRDEMEIMMELVDKPGRTRGRVIVGDLNMDDKEFDAATWRNRVVKGDTYTEKTWGGDGYCAGLVGKEASGPLNLDHNMIVEGTARSITTRLVSTGFKGDVLNKGALSDHQGLFSEIHV